MLPRVCLFAFLATVVGSKLPPAKEGAEPSATFRTEVDEVQLHFSAEDDRHHILENVTDADISVLEGGHTVRAMSALQQSFDSPLQLALAVDRSDSMQRGFAKEKRAAEDFLHRLVRPQFDPVFLVDFASHAIFSEPPPDRPDLVFAKVSSNHEAGLTALYDALLETTYKMNQDGSPSRRAIILMSDGDDNLSMHSLRDVIERAVRTDIAVYGITAHPRRGLHPGDQVLRQLAEATGGHAFILSSFEDADRILAQIEQELRIQYSLTFRPSGDVPCGFHRITVRHRNPLVRIRSKAAYYQCGAAIAPS